MSANYILPDSSLEQWSMKLPYDHPPTPNTSYQRENVRYALNGSLKKYLQTLDEQQKWSFLLTGCLTLLYRYCGQSGILAGLTLTTENGPNYFKKAIFIETSGTDKFLDLVKKVYQHATNGASGGLDVETELAISIITTGASNEPGIITSRSDGPNNHHPLHLIITNHGSESTVKFSYDGTLFKASTLNRMNEHLQNLWDHASDNQQLALADFKIFGDTENAWHNEVGQGTPRNFDRIGLHEDIERYAREFPHKIAVKHQNTSVTYAQLNHRANQLAHYLISKGMGPESRIMVCLQPSPQIAVALLGILKAGATYIPLNPEHPANRIKIILEDIQPQLVLLNSEAMPDVDLPDVPVLAMDTAFPGQGEIMDNPQVDISPHQTAYIYYTSGTTGKPKGSMGSYANLCHYIRVAQDKYGLNSEDIMPALASYTFSISMFELLSPLVAGGTLRIMERKNVLDAAYMVQTLQEVTFVHAGPSLLKNLVKYIQQNVSYLSKFNKLRHLSSGGDMVPVDLLIKLRKIFPLAELFVIYGCSEIGCMGCTYFYDPGEPVEKSLVGKPFDNVHVSLIDMDGNTVPVGVAGEVCFGGGGVAKGYLNRKELTEEKFFHKNGIRFYRTGDVGRLDAQGNLELLGRKDFQIQIRGMRMELGEVEYHLRQIAGIGDAVVVSRKYGAQDNVLVAYYVNDGTAPVSPTTLRNGLSAHLPEFMIPTFYMELDSLPLNINMKVDRKALLSKDFIVPSSDKKPETESELELASIWGEILKIDGIGLDDNFLALGGDSLLAMELIYVVEKKMGVKLEGMDILRESLQVLAGICDKVLQRKTPKVEDIAKKGNLLTTKINPAQSFFFGTDNSLYGLLHAAHSSTNNVSVLVCPPIGEYKRCHFLLKTLSSQLASEGIPVMRFDYFGTGDSYGETIEGSVERWQRDIQQAKNELVTRTKCQKVVVLSVRLGAMLALKALGKSGVDRWILWDPVTNGSEHYGKQKKMHKQKIWRSRVLRRLPRPKRIRKGEELVGFTYSRKTIKALRSLVLSEQDLTAGLKVHQVVTDGIKINDKTGAWSNLLGNSRVERMKVQCAWYELANLNTAITDRHLYSRLVTLLKED